jgi:hypothetical protein
MGLSLQLCLPAQTKPRGLHSEHHCGIPKPDQGGLRPHNHISKSRGGPAVSYEYTYSAICQAIGSDHPLNGRLGGYCRGLAP